MARTRWPSDPRTPGLWQGQADQPASRQVPEPGTRPTRPQQDSQARRQPISRSGRVPGPTLRPDHPRTTEAGLCRTQSEPPCRLGTCQASRFTALRCAQNIHSDAWLVPTIGGHAQIPGVGPIPGRTVAERRAHRAAGRPRCRAAQGLNGAVTVQGTGFGPGTPCRLRVRPPPPGPRRPPRGSPGTMRPVRSRSWRKARGP
jgi:hypothetical protein